MVNEKGNQQNRENLTKEDVITKLRPCDVLLGRGSPTINYTGNVAFRSIIKDRRAEYTASGQHKTKDRVAREVFHIILEKGGRFLRRMDPMELEKLEMSTDIKAWLAVDEEVALEKVKQALRDKDQSRNRSRAREAIAEALHSSPSNHSSMYSSEQGTAGGSPSLQDAWMQQQFMRQQDSKDLLVLAQLQRYAMQRQHIIDEMANRRIAMMNNSNHTSLALPTLVASLPNNYNLHAPQPMAQGSMFMFR